MKRAVTAGERTERPIDGRPSDGRHRRSGSITRSGRVAKIHRSAGNQAVQALEGADPSLSTLTISDPGDRSEREAERVAEEVVGTSAPESSRSRQGESQRNPPGDPIGTAHRRREGSPSPGPISGVCHQCVQRYLACEPLECEACTAVLQRTSSTTEMSPGDGDPEGQLRSLSGGRQLPDATRSYFEARLGYDFSDVRLHTGPRADAAARGVNARAFTLGRDVVFRSGAFQPHTSDGKRLLAHELTHVVQQIGPERIDRRADGDRSGRGSDRPAIRATPAESVQRWSVESDRACLQDGVTRAKALLDGNRDAAEEAFGKWGCSGLEFTEDGSGPRIDVEDIGRPGGYCAISWKASTGDDRISIHEDFLRCCDDCPDGSDVVDALAHTVIHESAHWCAATHGISDPDVPEEGDHVEREIFGGVHVLDDCTLERVDSYGDRPCYWCPYVVREGDTLWGIAKRFLGDGTRWQEIYNYEDNRDTIGDDPNLILPGQRLELPQISTL